MYNNVCKAFHFLYGDIALNIFFSGEGGGGRNNRNANIFALCFFYLSFNIVLCCLITTLKTTYLWLVHVVGTVALAFDFLSQKCVYICILLPSFFFFCFFWIMSHLKTVEPILEGHTICHKNVIS